MSENKTFIKNQYIWSKDIEDILDDIRYNSILLSEYHKKKYYRYKGYLKYFRIPTIVFSAISSVISVGLKSYFQQSIISLTTCIIGLCVGILNSMELFLQIQSTMENELINSKDFYLLSIEIYKILYLDNKNRNCHGSKFLDEKFGEYRKLIENSELIHININDQFLSKLRVIDIRYTDNDTKVNTPTRDFRKSITPRKWFNKKYKPDDSPIEIDVKEHELPLFTKFPVIKENINEDEDENNEDENNEDENKEDENNEDENKEDENKKENKEDENGSDSITEF